MNKIEYEEMVAFHPGYYVNDYIEGYGMTQEEFAKRLDVSPKHVSELVNGKKDISNNLAKNLSLMTGTSVELWINLQKTYDEIKMEIEKRKQLEKDVEIAKMMSYEFFVGLGVVEKTKNIYEKVKNLCGYLNISKLTLLENADLLSNFRTSGKVENKKQIINSNAWLQTAINEGRKKEVKDFDINKLKKSIPRIRELTLEKEDVFLPEIEKIFHECGVSFVKLPHLKNSGVNGVVKWLNKKKVILAINDKNRYSDIFWFSLFHEIKHVLQQKLKKVIVNDEKNILEIDEKLEKEADDFAREVLIPSKDFDIFVGDKDFSEKSITNFAKSIKIHPGIVVGRLQKERLIKHNQFNNLREKISR
jgi:addiction module HigA family antidote